MADLDRCINCGGVLIGSEEEVCSECFVCGVCNSREIDDIPAGYEMPDSPPFDARTLFCSACGAWQRVGEDHWNEYDPAYACLEAA